jgi:putative membrane protein
MAWLRTSISLIGFGFTIVQFFQRMQSMPTLTGRVMPVETPRNLGLALIATGVAGLGVSTLQYLGQLKYLWQFESIAGTVREKPTNTPAFYAALVLIVIG